MLLALAACKSNDKPKPAPTAAAPTPAPAPAPTPPPAPSGPAPVIDLSKLDRACAAATDCVVVKPAMCDPCACANEAIASTAGGAFEDAAGKLQCPAPDLDVKCEPCPARVAACENKLCVAKPG